jgi:hypothetical protein
VFVRIPIAEKMRIAGLAKAAAAATAAAPIEAYFNLVSWWIVQIADGKAGSALRLNSDSGCTPARPPIPSKWLIATFHFGRSPTGLVQARFNLRHTKRYAMASSHPLHFEIATTLASRATQKWRLIC